MNLKYLAAAAVFVLAGFPAASQMVVSDSYARSSSPNAKTGAAFMRVENTGVSSDRLINVLSEAARRTELHTHIMIDGIANMVHMAEGFEIEPGGVLILDRGGKHIMFMGLNNPFLATETVTVTLVFEHAGEIEIEIPVDLLRDTSIATHE